MNYAIGLCRTDKMSILLLSLPKAGLVPVYCRRGQIVVNRLFSLAAGEEGTVPAAGIIVRSFIKGTSKNPI